MTSAALILGGPLRGAAAEPDDAAKPPPLNVDYASWGVAGSADVLAHPGATCRDSAETPVTPAAPRPCILGSGGGLSLHGGYRSPGQWYIGGAYQFSKTDSDNLYRLGILQQLRGEMRYFFNTGYNASPYASWGVGGVVYGNEWTVETGGATAFGGVGVEVQLSRLVLLGMAFHYQPIVFAGFVDTADFDRPAGLAQYLRFELQVEIRTELSRN